MTRYLEKIAALGFDGAYRRLVWDMPTGYSGLSARGLAKLEAALIGFASRDN